MILIDTHILIWLLDADSRLGNKSRSILDHAIQNQNLYISAISFWELVMLNDKGRVIQETPVLVTRRELISGGLQEIPISGEIGCKAAELKDIHGDPADRIILVTALMKDMKLCTADKALINYKNGPAILNPFK